MRATMPAMQHRHFAAIAAMVRDLPERVNRLTVARSFAGKLASSNPNFDRERFIAACSVDDNWRNVDCIEPEYGLAAARKAAGR
ncbi:hypothetical protein LCM4576_08360 [Mesorhizobium sp. LCM 4576]|nr:hypothetical protein LCM4576_08360 [Mesorhizobium sp. LCM 4576]